MEQKLPTDLATRRGPSFQLTRTETVPCTREELIEIWPYMTNVWREKLPEMSKEGYKFIQCYCRCAQDVSRNPATIPSEAYGNARSTPTPARPA